MEIENFLLRFGRTRQPARRLGSTQIEAARAFGGRLFEAAFNGEVRSCLRSSLDEAHHQDAGLRIRLHLTDAPELNDLPWEFLLHPALNRFLALSAETPLVRYLALPETIRPLGVKPPLEVLTVISSPTDYPQLDVESEWRRLQESLQDLEGRGLLVLRRLESPTLAHLQRWLRRETCHILHFMGHGGFNPNTEDGLLLFSDEKGRGREVTGQALGTLLHDHRPLRLAVLNACEGARASRSDPFAGVAQSLVRQGIPAVIAMQFEISDVAAIDFAHELYAAVVDGYPVDAALAEARKALFFAGHELEWGTPVLYMRSLDGRIFNIELEAAPAAMKTAPAEARPATAELRPVPPEVKAVPEAPKTPEPQVKASVVAAPAPPTMQKPPAAVVQAPAQKAPAPVPKAPPVQKAPVTLSKAPPHRVAQRVPIFGGRLNSAGALSPAAPQGEGHRKPWGVPAWIGLAVLLGIAALIWGRQFFRSGEAEKTPASTPATVISTPITTREAGIYLTAGVRAGDVIDSSKLELVEGSSSNSNEPRKIGDVEKGCFETDLEQGHKLNWKDIGVCP
ncbi:MAG TPA: CHAT domain-containing protein [Thermoanaerobaculia bacterium]|nr:CHAT domain-containing protein [Thermoanaerobaculia bacterium]